MKSDARNLSSARFPTCRNVKKKLIILSIIALAGATGILYLLRDPRPHFDERRSAIASVQEAPPVIEGASSFQDVRITATSGLVVNLNVRRQLSDSGRRLPLAVILGGHVTGSAAARLVGETPGVAVAAVSYPFTGNPKPGTATFLREIPKIRGAFLDTPPALMLALDYLESRRDVDDRRIEGIGVSLGAPFITIAASLDPRFSRVWALHGSGGSYAPLEASMRRTIKSAALRAVAATIANVIIAGPRLAPEEWVADIAPRPFIMVNASEDERLPRSAVDALYESAAEPKEMMWMSGKHIHADRETIERLVRIVMTRIAEQG
jgi:dienelactone hydrolase